MKNIIRKLIPKKIKDFLAYREGDQFAFKSYAQEGEDILLQRIFNKQRQGFYVDVGAHHPFRFSNTKLLYDRGWTGINIEPNPDVIDLFKKHREKDINIACGVGIINTELEYYIYHHPALNTFDVDLVKARSKKPFTTKKIKIFTLSEILKSQINNNQQIDLLLIDVEGFDLQVLQSNDWNLFRPLWILVELPPEDIEQIKKDLITIYLNDKGYSLYSKLHRSGLFKLL